MSRSIQCEDRLAGPEVYEVLDLEVKCCEFEAGLQDTATRLPSHAMKRLYWRASKNRELLQRMKCGRVAQQA